MTRRFALSFALVLAITSWGFAEEGVLVVDPATAIRLAAGHHPAVLEERERLVELEAQISQARAGALPLVEADAPGEGAWRKAKERARRLRNRRPRP